VWKALGEWTVRPSLDIGKNRHRTTASCISWKSQHLLMIGWFERAGRLRPSSLLVPSRLGEGSPACDCRTMRDHGPPLQEITSRRRWIRGFPGLGGEREFVPPSASQWGSPTRPLFEAPQRWLAGSFSPAGARS